MNKELRHYRKQQEKDETIIYGLGFASSVLAMLSIFSYNKKEWFSFGMLFTTFISGILTLVNYIIHLNLINGKIKQIKRREKDEDDWLDEDDDDVEDLDVKMALSEAIKDIEEKAVG